jgi:hypothetical protein
MEIKKEELRNALNIVKPGLANKEIIEQSTSFVFVDDFVVTYNDEICITHDLKLGIKGAIKAEEMYNFLSKVKTENIKMEITETEIVMKAGRAKVGFALKSEILLPITEEMADKEDWKKLPKNFVKAAKFAAACASDNMSNAKLTCVNFDKKSGKVSATDNYRVVQWDLRKKIPFQTTLIPYTSINEVVKVKPKYVAQGKGWVHFKNDNGTTISCRVFNEKYVDIEALLNIDMEEGLLFTFPDDFKEILERADVFTKAQAKTMNEESIDVIMDGKLLKVECASETAWFKESVRVKGYKGQEFAFKITPYLLKDILKETNVCMVFEHLLKFEGGDWVYISTLRTEN